MNISKPLNISLWTAQGLLAAAFAMAGFMKMTVSTEILAEQGMTFVEDYGVGMVRFIGIAEFLGALGLILPLMVKIKPILTPIAAIGLSIIMVLACIYHISNNEPFLPTVVFFAASVFVAWGRFKSLKA